MRTPPDDEPGRHLSSCTHQGATGAPSISALFEGRLTALSGDAEPDPDLVQSFAATEVIVYVTICPDCLQKVANVVLAARLASGVYARAAGGRSQWFPLADRSVTTVRGES